MAPLFEISLSGNLFHRFHRLAGKLTIGFLTPDLTAQEEYQRGAGQLDNPGGELIIRSP
jgi:hypothetical protein